MTDAGATGSADLEHDLRRAFRHDRLHVAYQPIVRSVDGLVTGVEALLRWTDPHRGPVPAETIVAAAETSGLITEIGAWVLERGCTDRVHWLQMHPDVPLDLAVNVSALQLIGSDFPATLRAVLQRTGMDPAALVLEMTENVFLEDNHHTTEVLAALKALHVRLALDDFGTGYSSLSYLLRVPVDILKIDQGFTAEIDVTVRGAAIIGAITDLAHVLGLTVTAEGVETVGQRDEVVLLGCDRSQGYFYSEPMTSAGLEERLGAQRVGPFTLPAA